MAQKFYTDIAMNQSEIQDVSIEKLAADPTGGDLYEGRIWENSTSKLIKWYDGTSVQVIADRAWVTAQINSLGQIQGGFSALPGALPVAGDKTQGDLTAIKKGDFWVVTTAGSIAGISGGSPDLAIGDIIQFFGTVPATASHWLGIQRNFDDASAVGTVVAEKQTVSVVANTPLAVNAATVSNIHSIQIYDSAGALIVMDVEKLGGNAQRTLTSKKSLSNIVVEITGT